AVVAGEQDQRVGQLPGRLEVAQEPVDLVVDRVQGADHGRAGGLDGGDGRVLVADEGRLVRAVGLHVGGVGLVGRDAGGGGLGFGDRRGVGRDRGQVEHDRAGVVTALEVVDVVDRPVEDDRGRVALRPAHGAVEVHVDVLVPALEVGPAVEVGGLDAQVQ